MYRLSDSLQFKKVLVEFWMKNYIIYNWIETQLHCFLISTLWISLFIYTVYFKKENGMNITTKKNDITQLRA